MPHEQTVSSLKKRLEDSNQRLAAIVQSSDDAIISKSLSKIITSWNFGAEQIYGYTAKEAIGQPMEMIIPPEKMEEFLGIMEIIKLGQSVDHLETVRITKDGRRIDMSLTISPLKDKSGQIIGASGIGRDISQTKELERRKDAFIGMASHELKTPITTMKSFIQVIQKKLESNPDQQLLYFLSKTNNQLDKLTELVEHLLDLSKIQAGQLELKKEEFKLTELISESLENISGMTNNHQILIQGSTNRQVYGDKERLSQVMVNLLNNAIKYSPGSDKIILNIATEANKITVSIQDFGIGISKKHLERIFDRFFRAEGSSEKTFPGLGIGLYLSSELINRHGGKIWVKSQKNQGSTFFFTLPLK